MNVDVGTIKRSDLKGVGTTAGGRDFNIELQCSGGLSESGYANIQTSFPELWQPAPRSNKGRCSMKKPGVPPPKGRDSGTEGWRTAEFNKKYSVGTLRSQETRYITPYHARFYQYLPTTSTGEVESHMIFNLTYD
jgi:type 1 fimbria pilin